MSSESNNNTSGESEVNSNSDVSFAWFGLSGVREQSTISRVFNYVFLRCNEVDDVFCTQEITLDGLDDTILSRLHNVSLDGGFFMNAHFHEKTFVLDIDGDIRLDCCRLVSLIICNKVDGIMVSSPSRHRY